MYKKGCDIMNRTSKIIILCILLVVLSFTLVSSAAALENIEEIIGEKTTQVMINEIKNAVNKYSTITTEDTLSTIKEITSIYGLELTDEEVQEIYDYIVPELTAKITDNITLWDRAKMLISRLTQFVENTFPSIKDKEVVVTVPRMSQVDEWVNEGLMYVIRNILPLIDS